jgi:hypothetical protein
MNKKTLLLVLLGLTSFQAAAQEATWNSTLERISSAVVSIRIDSTPALDTERK